MKKLFKLTLAFALALALPLGFGACSDSDKIIDEVPQSKLVYYPTKIVITNAEGEPYEEYGYEYDAQNRLSQINYKSWSMTEEWKPMAHKFEYDTDGKLIKQMVDGIAVAIVYDVESNTVSYDGVRYGKSIFTINKDGQASKSHNVPANADYTYEYDKNNNVVKQKRTSNNVENNDYEIKTNYSEYYSPFSMWNMPSWYNIYTYEADFVPTTGLHMPSEEVYSGDRFSQSTGYKFIYKVLASDKNYPTKLTKTWVNNMEEETPKDLLHYTVDITYKEVKINN